MSTNKIKQPLKPLVFDFAKALVKLKQQQGLGCQPFKLAKPISIKPVTNAESVSAEQGGQNDE